MFILCRTDMKQKSSTWHQDRCTRIWHMDYTLFKKIIGIFILDPFMSLSSMKICVLQKISYWINSSMILNHTWLLNQFLGNIFFHFIHKEIIWALVRLVSNLITNTSNIPCLPIIVFLLKFAQGNADLRNIRVFTSGQCHFWICNSQESTTHHKINVLREDWSY